MSHGKGLRVNQNIRAQTVRLVDSDGTQIGIKPISEALAVARSRGLDLVEIAPQANPPVCRLLDYTKFQYEQDKKDREARRRQKAGLLKEVRLSPVIGIHDLDVKVRHISEFLQEHDKVRITVIFRGRQMAHQELGLDLLKKVSTRLSALASVEQHPAMDRNRMSMTLVPKG